MNSQEWVEKFFIYCNDNGLKPWEYDYKRFYAEDSDTSSSMELWLKYKMNEIDEPVDNSINKELGSVFEYIGKQRKDPDKVNFPIYQLFGWQDHPNDIIRGDSMNSFKTTFTMAIILSTNKDSVYESIGIRPTDYLSDKYDLLLKDDNVLEFEKIKKNAYAVMRYAGLNHTFGNFMPLNYKLNIFRGTSKLFGDYFDLTLDFLRSTFISIGDDGLISWRAFVHRFMLEPFVNNDYGYTVGELWQDHFIKSVYPKSEKDFKQFYTNVNLLIENRGKDITKRICELLNLQYLNFYDELKSIDHNKFFNEIIG